MPTMVLIGLRTMKMLSLDARTHKWKLIILMNRLKSISTPLILWPIDHETCHFVVISGSENENE